MIVDTSLSVIEFKLLTEALADGYFDKEGNYTPHVGLLNSMRLFYNMCVRESKFDEDIPHDFTDILLVDSLANDKEFMQEFDKATSFSANSSNKLEFSKAYGFALDIVGSRDNPFERAISKVVSFIEAFFNGFSEFMTDENMEKLGEFASQVKEGNIDYYKLMKEYGESEVMQKHFTDADSTNQTPSLQVVK